MQTVSVLDQVTQDLDRLYPGQINLSVEETAKAIGIHQLSIRNLIAQKKLPFQTIKIGARRLVPKRVLVTYLAGLETQQPKRGAPTKAQRIAKAAAARDPNTIDFVNGLTDAGRV